MSIEGPEDLEGLQRVGAVVAKARDAMLSEVRAGISTAELDEIARDVLREAGARSAPKLAYEFPGWTCISVNDELAHGIPSQGEDLGRRRSRQRRRLGRARRLLGRHRRQRSGRSGRAEPDALLEVTRAAQQRAMEEARAGVRVSAIGRAVERHARSAGFQRDSEHRRPRRRPLHPRRAARLQRLRSPRHHSVERRPRDRDRAVPDDARDDVVQAADGWTLRTPDGSRGAQFEHSVVVTNGAPIVLTAAAAA